MAAELRKLTHHPYNDLDLPLKDIKFEKRVLQNLLLLLIQRNSFLI